MIVILQISVGMVQKENTFCSVFENMFYLPFPRSVIFANTECKIHHIINF